MHLVLCDCGTLGNAYAEPPPVCTEGDMLHGILSGEYDNPLEVVVFDVSEGWSRDVSEDVVGAVVERARVEQKKLGDGARHFVEKHLDEELEPELCG